MQEFQFQAQFLANTLLVCTALGVLLSVRKLRGKGWLIAFLVINLVTVIYYFLINFLMWKGTLSIEDFRALQESSGRIIRILDVVSYALLIAFVLALKPPEGVHTGVSKMLFLFRGRVNRQSFWIVSLTLFLLNAFIALFVADTTSRSNRVVVISAVTGLLWFPVSLWISLAVQVKRWHDRDKSGWWVLIGLIPIVGGIWALIENGFLRGTDGSNRYGPEPSQEISREGLCQLCGKAVSGGGLSTRVGDTLVYPLCSTCYSTHGGSDLTKAHAAM